MSVDIVTKAVPVSFTESAIMQLNRIFKEENLSVNHGIRIGVKGGGCSGFSYILGFDEQKDKDEVYEINGLKVFMEKSHSIYLIGMEIDWKDDLDNRGFIFTNPNAKETCGCGTSFSA
ncbi:MAG TPA: iron-sulfur cluster assembly accessory protein [Saprospiraceae bacterium]|nr:iron-sulfur cluster assembly accessory protein [Saprospiraceae bacterium]HRO07865.1 iron-sulfur cluster assembly accessory protein [Saprospiraceae bacterium]HRO74196.1 iron-sulfur cluster assembly accessory protein [Saprospiraceae bacterium]HRP41263.1 iron-sulfur cluster assembly accessory protein [Saprospiraceae bacterium]